VAFEQDQFYKTYDRRDRRLTTHPIEDSARSEESEALVETTNPPLTNRPTLHRLQLDTNTDQRPYRPRT